MIALVEFLEKQSFFERVVWRIFSVVDEPVFTDDFITDDTTVGDERADTYTFEDGLLFSVLDVYNSFVILFLTTEQSHEMHTSHETDNNYFG